MPQAASSPASKTASGGAPSAAARAAASHPTARPGWRRARIWIVALAVLAVLTAAALAIAFETLAVPPRLLAPYIERRSSGHHPLIEAAGRRAARLLMRLDRGTLEPRLLLPVWSLPPTLPEPSDLSAPTGRPPPAGRDVVVAAEAQLLAALDAARPGDVITLVPGTYRFKGTSLPARRAGRTDAPITVRAPRPGSVTLEFELLEGFHVTAPHWVFENLLIVGRCRDDSYCEHAFHVVGAAAHTVIRHNELREFNAHVKINGADGRFPDGGQLVGNRLLNTRARRTDNAVTPVDLVAANDWRIEANLIADFVKAGGDFISYGGFAKGGGAGNRFVRNVVLCEHRLRGQPGRRVGLSFGGGGTAAGACRDRRCVLEQERGAMHDNLIASCSDDGIHLNASAQTEIGHNTVVDTAGIDVRTARSSARLRGNLVDAPMRAPGGGVLDAEGNLGASLTAGLLGWNAARAVFADALELDLRWRGGAPRRARGDAGTDGETDLCGQPRPREPAFGAFEDLAACVQPDAVRR